MSLLTQVKKAIEDIKGTSHFNGGDRFPYSHRELEEMYAKCHQYNKMFQVGDFIEQKDGTGKCVVVRKEGNAIYVKEVLNSGNLSGRVLVLNMRATWVSNGEYAASKILGDEFDPDKKQRAERAKQARFRKKFKEVQVFKEYFIKQSEMEALIGKDIYVPDCYIDHCWGDIRVKNIKSWEKVEIKKTLEKHPYHSKKVVAYRLYVNGKSFQELLYDKSTTDSLRHERPLTKVLAFAPVEVL